MFPKPVARALAVAFEKRQLGDYESAMVIEKEDAENVLTSARETVALLSAWLNQYHFFQVI